MNINLALITGSDIAIPECKLIIHLPRLNEIGLLGEDIFFSGILCLNINKSIYGALDESLLLETSNFLIFMTAMLDKRMQSRRVTMELSLSLLCPNYSVMLLPNTMILTKENETILIDENNFDIFQDVIASMFCIKPGMGNTFNPAGKKSAEIALKLQRARARVAKDKGESETSSLATYISVLSIALTIPVTEVSKYTIFLLYDALDRYNLWLPWDLDIRSRLAGGKPDNKPENWMKNIH